MKQQQSFKQQSQNAAEAANLDSKAFQEGQKDAFNSPEDKTINGNDKISIENKPDNTHHTSPQLHTELTFGKNTAWNESATNDGDAEQVELDKTEKSKPFYTEIESKETREKRIKQSLIGEAF